MSSCQDLNKKWCMCRSLGQNFVTSEEVLQRIIASAKIRRGDKILEIGPGLGSLTDCLLDCGASVLAIEKDDVLYGHLQQKFAKAHPQPHTKV